MIRLHNAYEHPEQNRYMVYEFKDEKAGIYFEQMLLSKDIPYEKDETDKSIYRFGIHKKYAKLSNEINSTTLLKHKEPFIPVASLRWFVFAITIVLLSIAIVGYVKSLNA